MDSHQTQRGFTLLEMLVVILIISIGFSLITYSVSQGLEKAQDRQANTDLSMALRSMRNQAIMTGQTVILQFDLSRNSYQIPGKTEHVLPKGMRMRLITAANLSSQDGGIAFFPNGSSSGGSIYLERDSRTWRIDIAWLTGKVTWKSVAQP